MLATLSLLSLSLLAAEPADLEALDRLWAAESDAGALTQADALLAGAGEDAEADFELQWRLARLRYRQASREKTSASVLSKQGWDAAERAKALRPERVEGHYWTALCAGLHAQAAGITAAMRYGLPAVVQENAEAAAALDPSYEGGGPYRVLGCYWKALPWPLSDPELALRYLEQAVALGPKVVSNHYFLAELHAAEGRVAAARASLERALALPAKGAGDRHFHAAARALLAELPVDGSAD